MAQYAEHIDWTCERVACSSSVCAECAERPESHSVYLRGAVGDAPILYTKPAEATLYYDHAGIVEHFRNAARLSHPAPWVWVFDCEGLQMRHVLDPRTGLRIGRLLCSEFRQSVEAIVILKPNAVLRYSLYVVRAVLSKDVQAKIHLV